MAEDSLSRRTAQLDKAEREHLEDVVEALRERAEANVAYQLRQLGLEDEPEDVDALDEHARELVEAIELEGGDGHTWAEAFEQYVTGVGYTIVNRLAALRCMEVRGFLDEEVTVFMESGLTPAADTVMLEEFLEEDEAIVRAYRNECDRLADEIEILFDRSSAYSLIDPDADTYEDLCGMLDDVPDEVWRADDVLGWVYEYYNVNLLDDLRRKGDREGLEPEDVPAANQFYTPHWVVRMLTDNSLGKLYLEHTGELQDVVDTQESFSPDERKNRALSPDESPDIADFCTYLVPSAEEGEPTDFDHPRELNVIDPACGSGHFLLYAFDVLERIWRAETDLADEVIPRKILEHNLYGVDLDMRACQLAAFSLYLKGRTRAEAEGSDGFDMPEVGIVCADASIAEIDGVEAVFDEVAGDDEGVADALQRILDAFEEVHGLGSLLDVRGTLGDLFEDDADAGGTQLTLGDDPRESHTLGQVLHSLREAVEEHHESESFLAQDLRSFVRLLDILAQEYDVALMNPPYGSQNRMPDSVERYVESRYAYDPEFYISFFEVCDRLTTTGGRIGMLVPWSFMFKRSFEAFRSDFVGERGSFDFLAEYGYGVLDNATVGTVGTVVRTGGSGNETGTFIRLHDQDSSKKEDVFLRQALSRDDQTQSKRLFSVSMDKFKRIPGKPISYSTPGPVRELHSTQVKIDADSAGVDGESASELKTGLQTGNNERFVRYHWEVPNQADRPPIAKGGATAWVVPEIDSVLDWRDDGAQIKRIGSSVVRNESAYGREGLTWTHIKRTGRRFGYLPAGSVFDQTGNALLPSDDQSLWAVLAIVNSNLYHALFLSITTERHWNVGDVGRIPWLTRLESIDGIAELAKRQYAAELSRRTTDPTSPFYCGPGLLRRREFFYDHPHVSRLEDAFTSEIDSSKSGSDPATIPEASRQSVVTDIERRRTVERFSREIDNLIYDRLNISAETREDIRREIFLRTAESPEDRDVPDPESVPEVPDNIDEQVKDLVHHFAMEAVREEDDGIVPVYQAAGGPDMLDRIVERFEDAYGEHAPDRLVEVDEILGTESAAEEAYPNLRAFITEDLLDYHVDRMENAPIVWRLTTERLVSDATGEGFACFLDYHNIDSGLFDRLSNRYLEPRKGELRERRSAADRRRGDDSLSASERAEAAERYERWTSALDQIGVFEDVLQDLGSVSERRFDDADRQRAAELAPKVAAFREETRDRVDTLAELHERKGEAWFKDIFSNTFWETVDGSSGEWLDALGELEHACEEYAKPADEPVEAHLADLFDYFTRRLKGSDHYSSSGILFMTYYFEREGAELLDETGRPFDTLTDDERRLASLATGLDDPTVVDDAYLEAIAGDVGVDDVDKLPPLAEFKALAEEIGNRCATLDKRLSSDWADRARSEITTEGYRPNRDHGVEINITPLAEAEIVPKTVEDTVL